MSGTAVILDTETTGLVDPKLVEAAYLVVKLVGDDGEVFYSRYNPGKPIEYGAMATHHITDEDVKDEPPSETFKLPEGTEYIIGHNIDFDWKVIDRPNIKRICTLALCRKLFPLVDSHKLGAMAYFFDGEYAKKAAPNAHDALADVYMCKEILRRIIAVFYITNGREFTTWEEVWKASEEARIPDVISFGKHKGTKIAELPADYVRWLKSQKDVDEYLLKALSPKTVSTGGKSNGAKA